MVRSLLIKLIMLAATAGLVFWIGWPVPNDTFEEESTNPPADEAKSPGPTGVVSTKQTVKPATQSAARPGVSQAKLAAPAVSSASSGKLDLNRAGAEALERLPGVGPVLARRIVDWRREHGGFTDVEQLNRVKGIGEKKLKQIRPLVTVAPPTPSGPTRTKPQ